MALIRAGFSSNFLTKTTGIARNFSVTSVKNIKESMTFHNFYEHFIFFFSKSTKNFLTVVQKEENGVISVHGITKEAPKENLLLKEVRECRENGTQFCPKCTLGLDVKHTDVLILSQYVRSDGCMLPRRITGLCRKQQNRMSILVSMAQKSGLMPNLNPEKSKKDPTKRFGYRKFNKYFDENTIKQR